MGTERRRYPRVAIPLDGAFSDSSGWGKRNVRIADIGQGGCFIDAMSPPAIGTALIVEIAVAGRNLTLPAEVVYVDRIQGFAVQFANLAPEAETELSDAITDLTAGKHGA